MANTYYYVLAVARKYIHVEQYGHVCEDMDEARVLLDEAIHVYNVDDMYAFADDDSAANDEWYLTIRKIRI